MAFNGKFVVNLAQFGASRGGDMQELLRQASKGMEELCTNDCVISNQEYQAVIETAMKQIHDPYFGLHAGENLNLSAAGLIGQITQTSSSIKEAIQYCCEFANLGCSVLPMSLKETQTHYEVTITPDEQWRASSEIAFRQTVDGVMAFTMRELESLTLSTHKPLAIHLPWNDVENADEYQRVMGSNVHFNQKDIAILLAKKHVEQPIVNADYQLLRILVAHAQEKSERIGQEKGFQSIVKQSVLKLVKPHFPTIEEVAGHLSMSARTLQRRLKEEGVTYKQMINDLRLEMAKDYLKQPQLSIKEIAYLLSYAESSTFIRSFKLRTGKTPKTYRSEL